MRRADVQKVWRGVASWTKSWWWHIKCLNPRFQFWDVIAKASFSSAFRDESETEVGVTGCTDPPISVVIDRQGNKIDRAWRDHSCKMATYSSEEDEWRMRKCKECGMVPSECGGRAGKHEAFLSKRNVVQRCLSSFSFSRDSCVKRNT